ncbi:MAG TPA: hypothetical protein PLV68_15795, partial [Ilumatobacteraceae bacterium]|nr:hypothetical protein [Ilumatobacteraceae bacterium]
MSDVNSSSRVRRARVRGVALLVTAAALAAACSSGSGDLSSAGNQTQTTQPTTTTAATSTTAASTDSTTAPDSSGDVASTTEATVAPTTTDSALLDSLPGCDTLLLASASGPVEITFWHALSNENGAKLEEMVTRFNGSQNEVKVNIQFQGGYDENATKYLQ